MAIAVVDKLREGNADALWQAMSAALRDATRAARKARVYKTMASDAVEEYRFNTARRIKQRPLAAVGAAFAIGIPAGILIGWFTSRL